MDAKYDDFRVDVAQRTVFCRRSSAWVRFGEGGGETVHTDERCGMPHHEFIARAREAARAAGVDVDARISGRAPFFHPRCNAFGRIGSHWMPMEVRGDPPTFYDPSGLAIVPPAEWRSASREEISVELTGRGELILWKEVPLVRAEHDAQ